MGTAKRERQRANRQSKLQAAEEARRKAKGRRRVFRTGGLVAAALLAALLYSLLAGGDDTDETADAGATTTTAAADETTVTPTAPPPGKSITGATPCPPADGSAERTTTFAQAPPTCIDPAKRYTATMRTNVGELTIALDAAKAPKTVNNFVVLSRYKYYDGVPFHRIVNDFVAQAGDANPRNGQLGTGGPGYTFPDELPASPAEYVPGVVAMANSGANTNGSQFFIFVGPNNPFTANPNYSIFGKVTTGMDTTVQAIMAAGTEDRGVTELITIESVTITES
jgi:cyclophilin family peptidyl-prolyl cis-trans isomerase